MIMVITGDVVSTSLLMLGQKQLPREETWRGQDAKHSWSGREVNLIQGLQVRNHRAEVKRRPSESHPAKLPIQHLPHIVLLRKQEKLVNCYVVYRKHVKAQNKMNVLIT